MRAILRAYEPGELGPDGYPLEWHESIKHDVREQAGYRCVRCGHPYRSGQNGNGEWSPCDEQCCHAAPYRWTDGRSIQHELEGAGLGQPAKALVEIGFAVEARWRILTVHHLTGDKADCRWWNLAALCQRCHLTIQGRVQMHRPWPWDHSEWMRPYAAGFYAWKYGDEELTRVQVMARCNELLELGKRESSVERMPI